MPKPEWGTKRTCQSCGVKFYDMAKSPIVCPKCEAIFEIETKTRKTRAPRVEEVVAKPVAIVKDDEIEVDDVDVEDVEDDDDETDAALLPDDDEDEDDLNDVGIAGTPGDDDEDT